jgi:hypothetical protein
VKRRRNCEKEKRLRLMQFLKVFNLGFLNADADV